MPYKNNLKIHGCAVTAEFNENVQELLDAAISFAGEDVFADREDRREDQPRTDEESADNSDASSDRSEIGKLMLDAPRCACNHGRRHGGAQCTGFVPDREDSDPQSGFCDFCLQSEHADIASAIVRAADLTIQKNQRPR